MWRWSRRIELRVRIGCWRCVAVNWLGHSDFHRDFVWTWLWWCSGRQTDCRQTEKLWFVCQAVCAHALHRVLICCSLSPNNRSWNDVLWPGFYVTGFPVAWLGTRLSGLLWAFPCHVLCLGWVCKSDFGIVWEVWFRLWYSLYIFEKSLKYALTDSANYRMRVCVYVCACVSIP